MTTRQTGGKIAPDGRPAQAPGVGANARRHDLERPPPLHDSSLQQGDVQMLERGQRAMPKRRQPPAQPQRTPRRQGVQRGSGQFAMSVPDPIELAGQRAGGRLPLPATSTRAFDPTPWVPMLQRLAVSPNAGGGLSAAVVELLASARRQPLTSQANLIDLNELDATLEG